MRIKTGDKYILTAFIFIYVIMRCSVCTAMDFTNEEYKKALWMATRMYGAQRSGEGPNWLVMDHGSGVDFTGDSDNGYSVAGGWHDCGDHVKFGQTEFYAAYILLKAYAEFPGGFYDYYSSDYHGYQQAADFTWEGKNGVPNGIPDILDEVKYATDYFIRCTPDEATFYYQVGEGAKDHSSWVTSVEMASLSSSQGGEPRTVYKNPAGSAMASLCAAALSLMSRVYVPFDASYADTCLAHAINAYGYAKNNPGSAGTGDGGFYPPNAKWEDDFVIMATELYFTTGEEKYLNEALEKRDQITNHGWSLCYNNADDVAAYNLAAAGLVQKKSLLLEIIEGYENSINSEGISTRGSEYGILRYSAAQAFSAALYDKLSGSESMNPMITGNLDYIMGSNSRGFSFIVGFGDDYPLQPHHRNVYLDDGNQMDGLTIPERNRQFGYMVGGVADPSLYVDDIHSYELTEGGIDYNAGLVGALGALVSEIAPADPAALGDRPHPAAGMKSHEISVCIRNSKTGPGLDLIFSGLTGGSFPAEISLFALNGQRLSLVKQTVIDGYTGFPLKKHAIGSCILRIRIRNRVLTAPVLINL